MDGKQLSGYYTYRSFLDNPLPVNDFNTIKFDEAELFLIIGTDGTITGNMSTPALSQATEKDFMDIEGTIKYLYPEITLEFQAKGRANTKISGQLYNCSCSVAKTWDSGIDQRGCLIGNILRVKDHDSEEVAKAGVTNSFIAVKRDFVEPRDITGVSLIPTAQSMLASKSHRLIHSVWHTLRLYQVWWLVLNDTDKQQISQLGWNLERHPYTERQVLNLSNGAGEDFLFMHRKMIYMIRAVYESEAVPYIESWKTLPSTNTPQFVYSEQDDPNDPTKKIYRYSPSSSGFMIPPAYFISNGTDSEKQDLEDLKSLEFLKSSNYFSSVMRYLERQFKDPRKLGLFSLGELGNLLEFVIHNQMHMRWSSVPTDPETGKPPLNPETGKPTGRSSFDFSEKWNSTKYDYLGDFYSSHVNPVFWRLHGWIDDRIEDWFNAHEVAHPGEIERYEYRGIPWFKPGKWVKASELFYWPEKNDHNHNHHHEDNDEESVKNMLKVMEIIEKAYQRPQERGETMRAIRKQRLNIMNFMQGVLPHI
jgi:hypothetical protein